MTEPFDWDPFAGDRWSPDSIGDSIVGTITKLSVEKGQRGDVPVVTVREKESGREQEIWPPVHLKGLLASSNVQVDDLIAVKLVDLKNTGQPQPMKVFALKVKKAETSADDDQTEGEQTGDFGQYDGDGQEPF